MDNITDEFIKYLITCRKVVTKSPKQKFQQTGCNMRNELELSNTDSSESFIVFLRQNTILPDHYSIGLRWKCIDLAKEIILFRCNGPHGGNIKYPHHFKPHVHYITAKDINEKGIYRTTQAEITNDFYTFDEAMRYFFMYCGVDDAERYFPSILTQSLFDNA